MHTIKTRKNIKQYLPIKIFLFVLSALCTVFIVKTKSERNIDDHLVETIVDDNSSNVENKQECHNDDNSSIVALDQIDDSSIDSKLLQCQQIKKEEDNKDIKSSSNKLMKLPYLALLAVGNVLSKKIYSSKIQAYSSREGSVDNRSNLGNPAASAARIDQDSVANGANKDMHDRQAARVDAVSAPVPTRIIPNNEEGASSAAPVSQNNGSDNVQHDQQSTRQSGPVPTTSAQNGGVTRGELVTASSAQTQKKSQHSHGTFLAAHVQRQPTADRQPRSLSFTESRQPTADRQPPKEEAAMHLARGATSFRHVDPRGTYVRNMQRLHQTAIDNQNKGNQHRSVARQIWLFTRKLIN